MNLEKELKKKKESQIIDYSKTFTAEVQKLLADNSDADKKVLRESGLGETLIKYEQTKQGTYLERKALDEKNEGDVFSEVEIKAIAVKYGLRFLPAKKFQGEIASYVPTKLREFFESNGTVTGADYSDNVLILAPTKCFSLSEQPRPVRKTDPILFYKIQDGYYKMICKWGKDLTVWNYLKSIRRRNEHTYFFLTTLYIAIILNFVLNFMYPTTGLFMVFMSIVGATIVQAILQCVLEDGKYKYTTNQIWNVPEIIKGI